jgi:hypothetical protein
VLRKVAVASQMEASFTAVTVGHAPTPCSSAIDAVATVAVVDGANANSPVARTADRLDLPLAHRLPTRRATVAPLSTEIYKLQVTISATTRDKLGRALDLLRHSIPTGSRRDQELRMVLDRQVRRQQPRSGERDRAFCDRLEQRRETPRGAHDLNAVIGGTLVEVQDLSAVREERGAAFPQVQAARIDLYQRAQEIRSCATLL